MTAPTPAEIQWRIENSSLLGAEFITATGEEIWNLPRGNMLWRASYGRWSVIPKDGVTREISEAQARNILQALTDLWETVEEVLP